MSGAPLPLRALRVFALYAQGLTRAMGADPKPTAEMLLKTVERLGCLQIDALQRVRRSHYLTLWSRLGSYDPHVLDELAYGPERRLFEYWFHAACLLPLSEYRYRIPRMRAHARGRSERERRWLAQPETQARLARAQRRIAGEGALRTSDFRRPAQKPGWWGWTPTKRALEHLVSRGDLMVARREGFRKVYDLTERVLPDWVDRTPPTEEQAARHVLERSMRALGACHPEQLADYSHDLGRTQARPIIAALMEEGLFVAFEAVLNDGEIHTLITHREALDDLRRAAAGELQAERTTFLNPFDSLFYPAGRDRQIWAFDQVLEAYKPAADRRWGYFSLPILHRERLIGRFDPKLDRKRGRLQIERLHLEPGVSLDEEMVQAVAGTMRHFLAFHHAADVTIVRSEPAAFGRALLKAL